MWKKPFKYVNGYPAEGTIRNFLITSGIEPHLITFSADYSETKRTGILWTKHCLTPKMIEFEEYLIGRGVLISGAKYKGLVHSIWFLQDETKI